MTYIKQNKNMAATDEQVQVSAVAISPSKLVCRLVRIVPKRKADYSGTASLANNKKTNHKNHMEVSKSRGPATATEAPPTAVAEDELVLMEGRG